MSFLVLFRIFELFCVEKDDFKLSIQIENLSLLNPRETPLMTFILYDGISQLNPADLWLQQHNFISPSFGG